MAQDCKIGRAFGIGCCVVYLGLTACQSALANDHREEQDTFAQLKRKCDSTDPREKTERKVLLNTFEHQIEKNNVMNHKKG